MLETRPEEVQSPVEATLTDSREESYEAVAQFQQLAEENDEMEVELQRVNRENIEMDPNLKQSNELISNERKTSMNEWTEERLQLENDIRLLTGEKLQLQTSLDLLTEEKLQSQMNNVMNSVNSGQPMAPGNEEYRQLCDSVRLLEEENQELKEKIESHDRINQETSDERCIFSLLPSSIIRGMSVCIFLDNGSSARLHTG